MSESGSTPEKLDFRIPAHRAIREAMTKTIAAESLGGKTYAEIATELKISEAAVKRIAATDDFKEAVREFGESAIADARNLLKARSSRLAPKVWAAIEDLIQSESGKNKAEGIKAYFRVIGLEKNDVDSSPSQFVINLPGQQVEVVTPVEAEDVDTVQES